MQSVLIAGGGYTGLRLAQRWLSRGAAVRASATRPQSIERIAALGVTALTLPLDRPVEPLPVGGSLVYYLVPPPQAGDDDPRLGHFLEALRGIPERIVYMSTTGVYGDRGGARVDEETPPDPRTARARRRLAAERALRTWAESRAASFTILRVPGIYGPGRLPLERLAAGHPAIRLEEAGPGNRIHVDDLVSACLAAGTSARAHRRIYNVTDGSDESHSAWLLRVARIAGLPPPPLLPRDEALRQASPTALSFLGESRRVDAGRLRSELGVRPLYEDLDAGIRASLVADARAGVEPDGRA